MKQTCPNFPSPANAPYPHMVTKNSSVIFRRLLASNFNWIFNFVLQHDLPYRTYIHLNFQDYSSLKEVFANFDYFKNWIEEITTGKSLSENWDELRRQFKDHTKRVHRMGASSGCKLISTRKIVREAMNKDQAICKTSLTY